MNTNRFKIPFDIALGGVPFGNGFEVMTDEEVHHVLETAWNEGYRFFDTSPWYGLGLSEIRMGNFLKTKNRDEYLLSTKVGRILTPTDTPPDTMWNEPASNDYTYDYTAEGTRKSIEDSLERLGVSHIDYVFIHDLAPGNEADLGGDWKAQFEIAKNGAMPELTKMKQEGLIKGWGFGVNDIDPILESLKVAEPDVFLSAISNTILDHDRFIEELLPAIENSNATLIAGAPFNAGMLTDAGKRYNYEGEMPEEIVKKYTILKEVAKKYKVSLSDAAIQFSHAPEFVDTVLFGCSTSEQVKQNAQALDVAIPIEFWDELTDKGVIHPKAGIGKNYYA
ncbi:D-threo-aldose 1-dehydrogenase [Pustulibacterium marinum]|uniref:D-threo-aldose 1-dehydrogenase n=1 Tax=Pustulibacterium marinum TaxID=1224947 RepID=A0A1I7H0M1_9FLAO|nr:aldo/keto reductase [Pustulibacterium marinum]SFU54233.1 D-threo-aldose 1-dehydrogenase [Pustulibacterium marinum]